MFLQWWRLLKLCSYSGGDYSNYVPTVVEITQIMFLQWWWRLLKLCSYSGGGDYSNYVPTVVEITKIMYLQWWNLLKFCTYRDY
jgi:hypothetical protein